MITSPFTLWGGRTNLQDVPVAEQHLTQLRSHRLSLMRPTSVDGRRPAAAAAATRPSKGKGPRIQALPPVEAIATGSNDNSDATKRELFPNSSAAADAGNGGGGDSNSSAPAGSAAAEAAGWQLPESAREALAIQRICRMAYTVIRHMFHDNRESEVEVAAYMDVFIQHIGFALNAEATVTGLLTNNLRLLEQLQVDDVKVFLTFIRTKGKRAEYLDFLTALCR